MNHVAKRTITALTVAAVVVLGLLYLPKCVVYPLLAALIVMVHLEFSKMVALKHEIMVVPGVLAGAVWTAICASVLCFGGPAGSLYRFLSAPILVFMLALSVLLSKTEKPLAALGTTMLGLAYIPFMLSFLFFLPLISGDANLKILLYTLAIVKISDMGGFAFGMAFGKHKMCPAISPKKSWEGMAGSVFASCLISCAFMPMTGFGWLFSIFLGGMAAVVGTLGDLVESRFKREAGVKDSSQFKWTNGMGGFLDMFDSLVFAPAVIYVILVARHIVLNGTGW